MRGRLLEILLVLLIWGLLIAFIIYDTPRITRAAESLSQSYRHLLDETCPTGETTPASAGDFYYGGIDR